MLLRFCIGFESVLWAMISHSTFLWDKSMYGIHHGEASLACKGEALMALVTANAAATTVPVSMTCILIQTGSLAAALW